MSVPHPLVVFADGVTAVEFLRHFSAEQSAPTAKPCLMILDLKMPIMNGFEVLQWLGKEPLWRELTTLVLSTSDLPEDRARAHELGARGFLTKFPAGEVLRSWIPRRNSH